MVLGEVINRTARQMRRLADERLRKFGLSSGYLPVLTALMEHDGLTQKSLVAWAGIEQPTMVKTLVRMERDGIIERHPDPTDRRSARISLTTSIAAQLPEIRVAIELLNDEAVKGLTAEERILLGRMLLGMSQTIEAILNGHGSEVTASTPATAGR